MSNGSGIEGRFACPCCGYPTLTERAAYEICELCNWEDDGQDDDEADEVWGGPNADYSLSEARSNFEAHRVMYSPGRDQRLFGGDSPIEFETKGKLIEAFMKLRGQGASGCPDVVAEILRLEALLRSETERQVREYESKHRGDD